MNYSIDGLKQQVKRVLDYSNDMNATVDKLLDGWAFAKRKLIQEFGGSLIIESPSVFVVDKPDEDKILEYRKYVDNLCYETANEELRAFLIEQGWTAFYANTTRELWDRFGYKIPKGMKLTRALKLFIKNKEELDKWQTRYSRLIQDVKITGRMCLSIHPLDFLSTSETPHDWRSCHSLDGEYRAGNLSYMLDDVTVITYLKSEGDYKLPNFPVDIPWNAKKWRMLLYINKTRDLLFASRPYPFDNPALVDEAFKMVQNKCGCHWPDAYIEMEPDEAINYIHDHPGAVHFNDILSSLTYVSRYKCAHDKRIDDCTNIEVGAPVLCLECEKEYIEFGTDYSCVNCGEYLVCEDCGCYMYSDEGYYLDDQWICPDCYDENGIWCNGCGEAHNRENPQMAYDEIDEEWYCPNCYDELIAERARDWVESKEDYDR